VEDLTHRLGKPRGVPYSVGRTEVDAKLLKAVEGLEEGPLPCARTRVDDQGSTLGRNVAAHTWLRTGPDRAPVALRIPCCWHSLITITKRVYASLAPRVSPDGASNAGSGRPLHLLRFVVLSRAVGSQDDLERSQAIEPARARRLFFGHASQEIRQHERVHILSRV
jgi:hypothetical protein